MNLGKPNPRLRLFPFQATFPYSVPSTHGRAGSPPSGAGGDAIAVRHTLMSRAGRRQTCSECQVLPHPWSHLLPPAGPLPAQGAPPGRHRKMHPFFKTPAPHQKVVTIL